MLLLICGGILSFYVEYRAILEKIMFSLFNSTQSRDTDKQLDTVNIDKNGIVSLNLDNELVQQKIKEQLTKLQKLQQANVNKG